MMEIIKKYKWIILWTILMILIFAMILLACIFEEKSWLGNLLQTLGTISGFYLTLLIFQHSKEGSDKQFIQQLEHLQALNNRQIDALKQSTEIQITTLQELTAKQISAIQETTEQQIINQQQLTERQVDSLHRSTQNEIESFEKNILHVANKLSDNSVFLAEILVRELENSVVVHSNALSTERKKLAELNNFTLFRTPEEKTKQIQAQSLLIKNITEWHSYLSNKLQSVRIYLDSRRNDVTK